MGERRKRMVRSGCGIMADTVMSFLLQRGVFRVRGRDGVIVQPLLCPPRTLARKAWVPTAVFRAPSVLSRKAKAPMAVFCEVTEDLRASLPIAVLLLPETFANALAVPTAVLPRPSRLLCRDFQPVAVFHPPTVLELKAELPVAVLNCPFKFCASDR